jgi:signal transduction histidine kinase
VASARYRLRIAGIGAGLGIFLHGFAVPQLAKSAEQPRILLLYNPTSYCETIANGIRNELERRSSAPLEVYPARLATTGPADEMAASRYADYLSARLPDRKIGLAVTICRPAMNFFRRYGLRFSSTPPVLAIMEENRLPSSLEPNETAASIRIDPVGAVENILRVLPSTRNISVVSWDSPLDSPFEGSWEATTRAALVPFETRLSFQWLSNLSFDDVFRKAATRPPRSAILLANLRGETTGRGYVGGLIISKVHGVANAPIFSLSDAGFGDGVAAALAPSIEETSRKFAGIAERILGGEALGGTKLVQPGSGSMKFDWREMQRWGINENRLPPGSSIEFRNPTFWQQYRAESLAITAAILLQAAIITLLLQEARHRRQAEESVRSTMAELAQMDRFATAGELSATIAHEVNQPLTGMVLRADAALRLLAAVPPNLEKVRDELAQIANAGHRLGDIVASVRAMFKKNAGKRERIDINSLISDVLVLTRTDLERSDTELRSQLDSALPEIMGDKVQLQQVILNLVMNAIEAMHSVQYRVLTVKSKRSAPDKLLVSMEDTGPGVDPVNFKLIFNPMFTTKIHGMGMGLSICSSIIEAHGGRIWVSAAANRGSIFQFELPIAVTAI